MKRKLSISELTTRHWTFEEDVRHYAALGFDGIGVWMDKLVDYGLERGIEILHLDGCGDHGDCEERHGGSSL